MMGQILRVLGSWQTGFALLWLVACGPCPARADYLLLKSGACVRGELFKEGPQGAGASGVTVAAGTQTAVPKPGAAGAATKLPGLGEQVSIRTLSGAVVTVASAEVQTVARRRLVFEQYERLRQYAADTLEDQWALAEWCRERLLKEQRETHLLRVIELDPDHAAAHRGLGHVSHEGKWTTQDEIMRSRGYVKHKGRWVLPQELELLQQEQRETEAEKGWYKRVHLWQGWLKSDKADRQAEGARQLQAIVDPFAIPALYKSFYNDPQESHRLLYVSILAGMQHERALGPLVAQSLQDESASVRTAALEAIPRPFFPKVQAAYVRALKHDLNVVVNRAAKALGLVGDETVLPELIDALVTRHKYREWLPDTNKGITVRSDGAMVPQGQINVPPEIALALLTGQLPYGVQIEHVPVPGENRTRKKEVIVRREEQNVSVLRSLQRLTGEDFGYDKESWRDWLAARKKGPLKPVAKP